MPGYQTKLEQITVRGVEPLTICSLLDRNQYADPLGTAERLGISSAAWPLFGLLWPSGAHLAGRLAARPLRAGERILEVGCGLALASLVGHRRGADITASDCHPLAGDFLAENLRLNALAPMKYRHGHWSSSPLQAQQAGDDGMQLLSGRFDLIVGSDLLYERDEEGRLAQFIARHAAPGAQIWIVDPDRGNRAAFNRHMAALGFVARDERIDRTSTPEMAAYKGRLLTYCQEDFHA